jgi:PRTRC genetic system ThiF family protein
MKRETAMTNANSNNASLVRLVQSLTQLLVLKPYLDTAFAHAAPVKLPSFTQVELVLVGCGGTGSWLAPAVAQLILTLRQMDLRASASFLDPDTVEQKNVMRQNFCCAEIGRYKAITLAERYGMAWGVPIQAHVERFSVERMPAYEHDKIVILVGCVDNAAGREELARAVERNGSSPLPRVWWLDCGNRARSGQVLLGSTASREALQQAFPTPAARICRVLPSPAWQAPRLLQPLPEESTTGKMSCAELAWSNHQSATINRRIAAEAADYLLLLLTGQLKRFATFIAMDAGSARSQYTTPSEIAKVLGLRAEELVAKKPPNAR